MLSVGGLSLPTPVLLAPMSGVTDMPFRRLVKKYGAGLVISEMIASEAMVRQVKRTMKMVSKSLEEFPIAVQLAGCDPKVMAEAARLNEDLGAHIIDINMGCPVKKVVNNYSGSALMKDEKLAFQIIEATVKAVKVPVTLKMRTGWDENNRNAPRLAKIAEECGIQMITIHGRTRAQMYTGKSDWSFIRNVKESVKIPVIGNGDVNSVEDAEQLLIESGADGVMIGRGSYGRPWFLQQVFSFLNSKVKDPSPPLAKQYETILGHIEDILSYYGEEVGVKICRKHLGWYSKGLHDSADFRSQINQASSSQLLFDHIHKFYQERLAIGENL